MSSPLVTQSSRMKEPLDAFEMIEALSLKGVSSSEPFEPPEKIKQISDSSKTDYFSTLLYVYNVTS